jgi:hypothetical protein
VVAVLKVAAVVEAQRALQPQAVRAVVEVGRADREVIEVHRHAGCSFTDSEVRLFIAA